MGKEGRGKKGNRVWPLYIDQVEVAYPISLLQLPPKLICNGKNTCFGLEGPEFKSQCYIAKVKCVALGP